MADEKPKPVATHHGKFFWVTTFVIALVFLFWGKALINFIYDNFGTPIGPIKNTTGIPIKR